MRRERREARQAALARLEEIAWDGEDLEEKPTEEIVAGLAAMGIETEESKFRVWAAAHGSVEAISEAWEETCHPVGKWEAYPFLAARALWARWMPAVFSPEVFIAKHFSGDDLLETGPTSPEEARRHWGKARAVMDLVAPADGPPRPDVIQRLSEGSGFNLGWWLGELPLTLARHGMAEEAIQMCRRLAPLFEGISLLGDLAVNLAEAGHGALAVKQVWENLARFPDDVWIRIKGGDVYKALGDLPAAEAMYRRAYGMTSLGYPREDREGAVERLLDLYEETGRETEHQILMKTARWKPRRLRRGGKRDPLPVLRCGHRVAAGKRSQVLRSGNAAAQSNESQRALKLPKAPPLAAG
jgi:hypothetical protein